MTADNAADRAAEEEGAARAGREAADELRGQLFTGLDRLAFALEMEAAEAVERGDGEGAARLEDRRLGVRLAQRLVAGVYADEVDRRIAATGEAYHDRTVME